ncbi:MAG: hemolysin III family protein [Spirochaetes bacterium]|nr:hemolysin III family protein [Spirochaetota bacterium]
MSRTIPEEKANFVTHLVGLIGAAGYSAWLISYVSMKGDTRMIASSSLFCASMISLYLASTLYHAARDKTVKKRLEVFDHCAIFALIAGSYTPFCLVGLKGAWGSSLFWVIWGLAFAGILFKLFFTGRFKLVSMLLYIGMGWLVVIAAGPMGRSLSKPTIVWLAAGGLAYTLGTVFYLNRKLPCTHAIWHVFVMLGTAAHGVAVATLIR